MTQDPRFDTVIDRRNTHSVKWDMMEPLYGVSPDDGLAMWVADMEFAPPACVQDAVQGMRDHGVYGYFGDEGPYLDAICWWMKTRHSWEVDPKSIFTTHGLVNGTAMCVETFTNPGDGVILFTPVYHAFAKVIRGNGRAVIEMPMVQEAGRYRMDFASYDAQVPAHAKMVILCSPHNPGGCVWTPDELEEVAAFAKRHDLILVSDEIHHDLTFGAPHTPMAHIEGIEDRLIMMTAATKTFNIAGSHSGNVIIADPKLRKAFADRMLGLGLSPNSFGLFMTTAAYSEEGAAWVDDLCAYLAENKRIFDAGVNAIPGVQSMELEATYLAWVDFAGTGMSRDEVADRVMGQAKIVPNAGPTFGTGGETFLRFNLGAPRAQIEEAVARLQAAFSDLQ